MKTAQTIILSIVTMLCVTSLPHAEVLHVTDDYETIGAAIDDASARDTILIEDGVYTGEGNINLTVGTRLVIMSENGPENCIIDCEEEVDSKAFTITSAVELIGVTITGGMYGAVEITNAQDFHIKYCVITENMMDVAEISGGGITVSGSDGLIEYTLISDNESMASGPGIFITSSEVRVYNCILLRNIAERFGGGIHITQDSDCEITNCIFDGNTTVIHDGGGVSFSFRSQGEISFCDFLNNRATGMGGGVYKGSDSNPHVTNCIFWNNNADQGNQLYAQDNGGEITISHCIVDGGDNDEDRWDGEEIIDEDPLLDRGRDPDWGLDGFFIEDDSPAIDAGSDQAEELGMNVYTTQDDLSPDEGVVDIGYHYLIDDFTLIGRLVGRVIDVSSNSGIQYALITTTHGQSAETDRSGNWVIRDAVAERPFDITASAPGWNDSTLIDLTLEENDEMTIDFGLLHAEFVPSRNRIDERITEGDSTSLDLVISNDGNGTLEWTSDKRPPGGEAADMWDHMLSYYPNDSTHNTDLEGCVFAGEYFYIAGRGRNNPEGITQIYVLDKQGSLVDSFPQAGTSNNGMKDLAWDGELLWGSGETAVIAFTTEGDSVRSWEGPGSSNQALTWDPDRELIWVASITNTTIAAFERDGGDPVIEIDRPRIGEQPVRIYGLAYCSDDPDGYPLYVIHYLHDTTYVDRFNPDTGEMIEGSTLIQGEGGSPSGASVSDQYDAYSWMLITTADNTVDRVALDRIDIWYLSGNVKWMLLEPTEGVITAGNSEELAIDIYTLDFAPGIMECDLVFLHNAFDMETFIPVTMTVLEEGSVGGTSETLPQEFGITKIYPNPFNSSTIIRYSLPVAAEVTAVIYDLHGREISTLIQQQQTAGYHHFTLDGAQYAAGIYLCRLEAGEQTSVGKVVLVK